MNSILALVLSNPQDCCRAFPAVRASDSACAGVLLFPNTTCLSNGVRTLNPKAAVMYPSLEACLSFVATHSFASLYNWLYLDSTSLAFSSEKPQLAIRVM